MKLLVLGATGAVGRLVVEQALAAGHEVTAFARNPADIAARHERLRVVQGDATAAADLCGAVAGHDAIVSAVGSRTRKANTVRSDTARNLVAAMKAAGVRRLVWLCASGVGDSLDQAKRSSFVFGRIIIPFFLKHVYADAAIADDTLAASGLEVVIVRPVGLTDKPPTGTVRVAPDAEKIPSITIPRADVARFLLDCTSGDAHVGRKPVISS